MTLTIERFNPVSFVVRGEEGNLELKVLGGRYFKNLKGGAGWLFSSKRHTRSVIEYLKENENDVPIYALVFLTSAYLIGGLTLFLNALRGR